MIRNFVFTINLKVNIPETITPELVKGIIADVDNENNLANYRPKTEKHQIFIDFIKNNEKIHGECIASDFVFKLSENGFEDELTEHLKPACFDDIALDQAKQLDNETRDFITQLYEDTGSNDDDDKIDENGKPMPNSKKDMLAALKREIDRGIIQHNLLNYEITAASLKIIK